MGLLIGSTTPGPEGHDRLARPESATDDERPATTAEGTSDLLLLAGRSGVGKSSVAYEVSAQLQAAGVSHCLIDGDNLSAAYPRPLNDPDGTRLTHDNLRAVWAVYTAVGHRRLIYVNTVSVLESAMIVGAMGGEVAVQGVLLTASDWSVGGRLAQRERGSALEAHVGRSAAMSGHLDAHAEDWVVRVATDGRTITDIANEVVGLVGWPPAP